VGEKEPGAQAWAWASAGSIAAKEASDAIVGMIAEGAMRMGKPPAAVNG
jgi:hypothetical protein